MENTNNEFGSDSSSTILFFTFPYISTGELI
jgi:hypothetical protein